MKTQRFLKNCLILLAFILMFFIGTSFIPTAQMDNFSEPTIDTIAGGLGDGLPAVNLRLETIGSFTTDRSGNLFITQNPVFFSPGNIIRRIDSQTNLIKTIAGLEVLGRKAETPAQKIIKNINYMKTDQSGRFLFVASDFKVDMIELETGNLSRYAGGGNPSTGNGDGGLATQATVYPGEIQIDSQNNLFIYDRDQKSSIRRVNSKTGIIERVVGGGKIPLSQSSGKLATDIDFGFNFVAFALDKEDNIFFHITNQLFKVDAKTQLVTPINFNKVGFTTPDLGFMAFDSNNTLFVTASLDKSELFAILKLDNKNNLVVFAGNKEKTERFVDNINIQDISFHQTFQISIDSQDNIFVADSNRYEEVIFRISSSTQIATIVAGGLKNNGDGGLASKATFPFPTGIVTDNLGNIYVSEIGEHRIRRIDVETGIVTTVAGTGQPGFSGDNNLAINATLRFPDGITLDKQGNLFISDRGNSRVRKVNRETGIITTIIGNPNGEEPGYQGVQELSLFDANIKNIQSLAFDSKEDELYLSTGPIISKADLTNNVLSVLVPYSQSIEKSYPTITINKKHEILMATDARFCDDPYEASSSLRKYIIPESRLSGFSIEASGCFIYGVTTDQEDNIFISNPESYEINKVDIKEQTLIKIAGTGKRGYSGDGGLASQAALSSFVNALTVDRFGNIYLSDSQNNAVRIIKGAIKPIPIIINTVSFQNQQLTINGKGYGNYGAKVFINGKDVSRYITRQKDKSITLIANKKDLGIMAKGNNEAQITIGKGQSNTLIISLPE